MVKSLDDFAHDVPDTPLTSSRDQFAERAYSLLTSSSGPGGVSDERRAGGGARQVRPDHGRPVVPPGATAGRSRCLVRHLQRPRHRPTRLGHAPAELPDHQKHACPAARQGCRCARRRPFRTRSARQHSRRHDGGVRPDAENQPQRRPRPSRPGQLGSYLRRGDSRRARSGQDRCRPAICPSIAP